jgi:hypothetical protein
VPSAVQHVRDPEAEVSHDSRYLTPRIHQRLARVRQGKRHLARHLTANDVVVVGDPDRGKLLRGARELDHAVELAPPS